MVRSRAHSNATSVLVDAVSFSTPLQAADRPSIWRIQSTVTSSISVNAGLDCQASPITPSPELSKSPSTLAKVPFDGK